MLTPLITPKLIIILIVVPLSTIIANTFIFYFGLDKQMVADDKMDDKIGSYFIVILALMVAPAVAVAIGFGGTYLSLSYFRKSDD